MSVFVVLSHTNTGVGRIVRKVTSAEYNHAAISLTDDLSEMYSFARPAYAAPALARLVRETTGMYTRNGFRDVPVAVFEIPCTQRCVQTIRTRLLQMATSGAYVYNFPSAMLFPWMHGLHGDRMYTCSEFVARCLEYTDVDLPLPPSVLAPCDLYDILQDYLVYEGGLLGFTDIELAPEGYYKGLTPYLFAASIATLGIVGYRVLCGRVWKEHS